MEDKIETKKVQVEIVETLRRVVTVEVAIIPGVCDVENVAINIANRMYRDEEIVLDSGDYVCTSINVISK
jgi:predicted site-specific integrase-resolvase